MRCIVSAILIILTLVELVCPKSNVGKPLKVITSLICVTVILSPFSKLFLENKEFEIIENQEYLEYLNEIENKTLTNQVKLTLKSLNFDYLDVKCERIVDNNGEKQILIKIYFSKQVINEDLENINNIEEIEKQLKTQTYLTNVSVEAVYVD